MKRYCLLAFLVFSFIAGFAQSISVKSFQALPTDMTASSLEGKRIDQNGEVAALIKVMTTEKGFVFEGGSLGIVDTQQRVGEIWVWVPRGLRKITILHQQLGGLRDYRFPIEIEAERTYEMVLTTAKIETIVKEEVRQQYLAFELTPPNAILEVNDQLWEVDDEGNAVQFVNFGTYSYRVRAANYHTEAGRVTVDDPDNTTVVKVALNPDFANVTLKVDAEAEIWVNNEKKGIRTWTGPLGRGVYKIECKQDSHETIMVSKEISPEMSGQTIDLPSPRPIFGSLNVESTPKVCKLFIDGHDMGNTPKSLNEILIGQHTLKLTKDGYADYTEKVTITKGQRTQVNATLSNGKEIQFTCNVPDAQLEIDGQRVGAATGTYQLTYGSHNLRATAADYQDYTSTFSVTANGGNSYSILMKSLSKEEETFTVNGVSFTMKLVEGGTFQMGSNDSEAYSNEKPVHSVTLYNYYMGETEVTQELWKAVMGSEPTYNGGWETQFGKGGNYPAYRVSWNEIQEFIRKLNQKTGRNFRLPTEAEWEYAARGGKKSSGNKYAGSNNIGSVAWYTDNSGSKTHAVKTKSPNELGLYDMSGNVYEWCSDYYGDYSSGSQTNPTGPSSGSGRVLRGGSWYGGARNCRVSNRSGFDPASRSYNSGFRLCLPQ